jgi:hypothetical protein
MLIKLEIRMQESHSMETDNSSIESVEDFKDLGTTLTDENSFRKKLRAD